ncbi:MAG: argininosuccinate lyase [Methylotenera sp.]|nr:argininosuccinate lyase [Oligoflexia bacterium]
MSKLWGGRFEKETDRAVEIFTASIGVDERLWQVDIVGSIAHVRMLGQQGIISLPESQEIIRGLKSVQEDIASDLAAGKVTFRAEAEDIHSEVERLLTEKIGPVAGKLHTARSRNDQVATDSRLYLRDQVAAVQKDILVLQNWLITTAEKHTETVLPGLTHMQHAQPVSLAHHLMAYFWMFQRDAERFTDSLKRINVLPLGSAALAGTSFPLDREAVARDLGFASVSENSLDAVSDRDFVVEFLSGASLMMMHLSRMAEELILWSTPEFGFVRLDDSVTTGSSIMPQKKNPDVAELIRGKVGRVYGALMGALTLLKALPLAYNRDLQEDKTFLFEGLDTVHSSLKLMTLMLSSAYFDTERMSGALKGDFSNATDLADDLVVHGMTFRQAHEVTGRIVRFCIEANVGIEDLSLAELQQFSPLFTDSILAKVKPVAVMQARTSAGGTGTKAVLEQIAKARKVVKAVVTLA